MGDSKISWWLTPHIDEDRYQWFLVYLIFKIIIIVYLCVCMCEVYMWAHVAEARGQLCGASYPLLSVHAVQGVNSGH